MRWTSRIKRHGGLQNLMQKRLSQLARLARVLQISRDDTLRGIAGWLGHHPLRLLSPGELAYLQRFEDADSPALRKLIADARI